jgi:hypothetical protein
MSLVQTSPSSSQVDPSGRFVGVSQVNSAHEPGVQGSLVHSLPSSQRAALTHMPLGKHFGR